MFFAVAVPFSINDPTIHGLNAALVAGVLAAVIAGIPLFGSMALTARWSEKRPPGDAVSLDRYYRLIERYLAVAGMGALGYLVGCWVTFGALHNDAPFRGVFSVVCIGLAAVSALVVLAVAVAKIGLLKRLEVLKREIANLKQASAAAEPKSNAL
jgi:hypothetical protein